MHILRSKPAIISFIVLALAVLGLLYYFLIFKETNPKSVTLHTYVCSDGSYYFMRVDDKAIEVAGVRYELVSEEEGMRYEGTGPMAFTINAPALNVSLRESGEVIAACEQGSVESTPILELKNI
ncbi:hypothetical protein KJ819_00380 [Patescibacteria group bacterium]|nr:hypothetical protein [Patescibacteria group bacterium]MBU1501092.1 hypothetical protein [Patescibacteria group bacterium]MBU2081035.1 hypothetical protein [Patescibacteria group bacterium]MBU2124126.1 hypothetical protein [Patescibacteria group bacterium]MBU2194982.1 hypothetical protein [Patescibacteria group bacterium]